jgi:hypothetical protein
MNTSPTNNPPPRPAAAWHKNGLIHVTLEDGRKIVFPCSENEYLSGATDRQRSTIEISPTGVHWPLLDEDLSIEGLLAGRYGRPMKHGGARHGTGRKPTGKTSVTLRLTQQARANLDQFSKANRLTLSDAANRLLENPKTMRLQH